MAYGSGKYGKLAVIVQELTQAKAVVIAVVDGDMGHGFEVISSIPNFDSKVPQLLRSMADEIEKDQGSNKN